MTNTQRLDSLKKELMKEAVGFGDDGCVGVISKTQRGAWIKIRQYARYNFGESESQEIKIEDVVPVFVELARKHDEYDSYLCRKKDRKRTGLYLDVWAVFDC